MGGTSQNGVGDDEGFYDESGAVSGLVDGGGGKEGEGGD